MRADFTGPGVGTVTGTPFSGPCEVTVSSRPNVQSEQRAEQQPRWRLIGPGLVVAATGVGAADLVAT
ncbi:MAG: hypothetical protein ACJ72A_17525, partial [Nocardioidaceae bacterium]